MLVEINNTEEIGAFAKAVRKSQGVRQDDIAETIERSHVYVGDIEAGKSQPNIGGILALFDELGIKVFLDVPIDKELTEEVFAKIKIKKMKQKLIEKKETPKQ